MRLKLQMLAALLAFLTIIPAGQSQAAGHSEYSQPKKFTEILDMVQRFYVRELSSDEILEAALKGMLQNLDAHSAYLPAKEFADMQENTSGEFTGIGIEITTENNQVTVVTPIEDTPAYKAGVKAGDLILAIDGKPAHEMTQHEVVSNIRGPKGTEVELLVLHKNSRSPSTIKIKRDSIPFVSVKVRFIEEEYLWIRLTRFSERTTTELRTAIRDVKKKSNIKGVVLDLRNNPGGLLDQSVTVSDVFLTEGTIVSIRGRSAMQNKEYKATRNVDITQPLVVLVNSGSASAAEIVAGALQDHKRAILIGEKTFGKGSVQQVIPLPDKTTAVKLTTALYYTPSGRSIQAEGIEPDMFVPFEMPRENDNNLPRISVREQDLAKHLENSGSKKAADAKSKSKVDPEAADMLAKDNQLRMALQMVKTLPKIQALRLQ